MAQKHMVVCRECGRQFDANRGGYYDKTSQRYTCKSCGKKIKGDARERSTGMRQSNGAMISKLVIGVMFLIVAFTGELDLGARCIGVVIAAAMIAWGLVPYLKAKKDREAAAAQHMAVESAKRNAPKICPACGAQTKGETCEYCGAPLK